ncbi:MAG: hypothetical protein EA401_00745, partial [Planctomycetota bacterium]
FRFAVHAFNAKSALFRAFLQAGQEIGSSGGQLCIALGPNVRAARSLSESSPLPKLGADPG